jgi:hypothetical protein
LKTPPLVITTPYNTVICEYNKAYFISQTGLLLWGGFPLGAKTDPKGPEIRPLLKTYLPQKIKIAKEGKERYNLKRKDAI